MLTEAAAGLTDHDHTEKYRNKYRVTSPRAQWWNYGWDAAYFVTICTRNREQYFGTVKNDEMIFSCIGAIADACWGEIPHHAKNIELGVYVVMPNHVHGILILDGNTSVKPVDGIGSAPQPPPGKTRYQNPGKNTISSIIGGYKSAVSKHVHQAGFDFEWQSRFHDHIIRDEQEFQRITTYIMNNPLKWKGR